MLPRKSASTCEYLSGGYVERFIQTIQQECLDHFVVFGQEHMANAILLVTFAENRRKEGLSASEAAVQGAESRLRAILMTSSAMIAGMLMTSNRPLEDWGKLLGDVPTATAIFDRLLEAAEIIQITGKSYRMGRAAQGKTSTT